MKTLKILLVSSLFIFPLTSLAFVGYGGHVAFSIPCTCSGGLNVYFDRLYINSPIPLTGFIYYPPFALLFSKYLPGVPLTWEVGMFTPGVQGCFIVVFLGCAPLPSLGIINYLGTSVPNPLSAIPVLGTYTGF